MLFAKRKRADEACELHVATETVSDGEEGRLKTAGLDIEAPENVDIELRKRDCWPWTSVTEAYKRLRSSIESSPRGQQRHYIIFSDFLYSSQSDSPRMFLVRYRDPLRLLCRRHLHRQFTAMSQSTESATPVGDVTPPGGAPSKHAGKRSRLCSMVPSDCDRQPRRKPKG